MSYQISKYEAIKALLDLQKSNNIRKANTILQIVRRAARNEIKNNLYSAYYIVGEKDKKTFDKIIASAAMNPSKEKE